MRRRKLKKQRKIILITSFILLFVLSTGYAAFSTNMNLNAKGNIKNLEVVSIGGQNVKTKNKGDGLYKDTTENNRYIYKGKSPNNYISFNNELWRIVAKEADGTLKIIKRDSIGAMQFDNEANRNNEQNTFCNQSPIIDYSDGQKGPAGCGIWSAQNGIYSNGIYSGTVTKDSTLNTYLNTKYLERLNIKDYIVKHNFFWGMSSSSSNINEVVQEEKTETWYGYIGLISSSDFIKSSTNKECLNKASSRKSPYPCSYENGNYLAESKSEMWVMDRNLASVSENFHEGYSVSQHNTVDQEGKGQLSGYYAFSWYEVKPVIFLKQEIKLQGTGEKNNPFRLS